MERTSHGGHRIASVAQAQRRLLPSPHTHKQRTLNAMAKHSFFTRPCWNKSVNKKTPRNREKISVFLHHTALSRHPISKAMSEQIKELKKLKA
jgi:hypothetical protein